MSRCADPTCWPIDHDYRDHTEPSVRVRRWLERGTVKADEPTVPPQPDRGEPEQPTLGLA